jgi:hypothetical protein
MRSLNHTYPVTASGAKRMFETERRGQLSATHQVCSYETLDVDDPESGDTAVIASAAIAMRVELQSG